MQAQTPPVILTARNLRKSFGGLAVLRDMSLHLRAGELLGVIGPNGAGKSTLFSALSGSIQLDSGQVSLSGKDVTHAPPESRIGDGLVRTFQIPRPFPRMTVLENVMTAAQAQTGEGLIASLFHPRRVAAEERANADRARSLIDFVSLGHLQDQPASVLSGGQRKLLELARAMMTEPRIILLDEPAAGVNPALLDLIIDRIAAINRNGVAVLLIEHNMEMIARLCPQVIVMAAGQVLAQGTPDEVSRRADVVDVYLEGMPG